MHVIDELCHPEPLSGLEGVPPAKHKSISVAPRADLDALLSRLRPDIIQLASLRSRKRDLESRSQINSRMTELFVKEKAFPLEPDDVMHIGGGLPHEKMGIQDVAKSAAQFAEQAAAATAALIAEHNSSNHKYKSSRIRGETKTAKGMSFEPAGSDFDISRKGVASELNNESTRPTIRMRAENESKVSKKQSRANLSLSSEEEEVIYSAPSSAQSARAISPRLDSNSASYYQSSRRQQAARELIRSREATSGEATEAERGFLPLLSGTIGRPSQEASLVGRQSELIKQATSSTDRRANKKEPTRKIGSKFSSAVVRPDASSTLESHEQLNLHSRANICDEVSYISTGSLIQSRKPSRELFNLSNGLDDVHDKLSRLLARADRAHDNADDGIYDTVVDTDSDAEESLPGCDVELAGAMQKMIRNINPRAAASIGAVEKLVLRAAEETGSVLI